MSIGRRLSDFNIEVLSYNDSGDIDFEVSSASCSDHAGDFEYTYVVSDKDGIKSKNRRTLNWARTFGDTSTKIWDYVTIPSNGRLESVDVHSGAIRGICFEGEDRFNQDAAVFPNDTSTIIDGVQAIHDIAAANIINIIRITYMGPVFGTPINIKIDRVEKDTQVPIVKEAFKSLVNDSEIVKDITSIELVTLDTFMRTQMKQTVKNTTGVNFAINLGKFSGGVDKSVDVTIENENEVRFNEAYSLSVTEKWTLPKFSILNISKRFSRNMDRVYFSGLVELDAYVKFYIKGGWGFQGGLAQFVPAEKRTREISGYIDVQGVSSELEEIRQIFLPERTRPQPGIYLETLDGKRLIEDADFPNVAASLS